MCELLLLLLALGLRPEFLVLLQLLLDLARLDDRVLRARQACTGRLAPLPVLLDVIAQDGSNGGRSLLLLLLFCSCCRAVLCGAVRYNAN